MKGLNIISGDVVEVAPAYDHAGKRERERRHGRARNYNTCGCSLMYPGTAVRWLVLFVCLLCLNRTQPQHTQRAGFPHSTPGLYTTNNPIVLPCPPAYRSPVSTRVPRTVRYYRPAGGEHRFRNALSHGGRPEEEQERAVREGNFPETSLRGTRPPSAWHSAASPLLQCRLGYLHCTINSASCCVKCSSTAR